MSHAPETHVITEVRGRVGCITQVTGLAPGEKTTALVPSDEAYGPHREEGIIEVPRDRQGSFEPLLIGKHERRFTGFDDKIVAMYARGMTVREIQGFLAEQYGTDVSPEFISSVTDAVMAEVTAWQSRPLEAMYPVVFFDALRVRIRDEGTVRNPAERDRVSCPGHRRRRLSRRAGLHARVVRGHRLQFHLLRLPGDHARHRPAGEAGELDPGAVRRSGHDDGFDTGAGQNGGEAHGRVGLLHPCWVTPAAARSKNPRGPLPPAPYYAIRAMVPPGVRC